LTETSTLLLSKVTFLDRRTLKERIRCASKQGTLNELLILLYLVAFIAMIPTVRLH